MYMCLYGFGMGIMFANFYVCGVMLFSAILYMLVRYLSPKGLMCFRCLMFIWSAPRRYCLQVI